MKSNSKRETTLPPIAAGRPYLPFLACAILFLFLSMPFPAVAGVSLTEMARLEASDAVTIGGTRSLFRGYLSLGLLPEGASLLERRVRLGVFPAAAAAPLFDEVVSAQGRYDDPERLVAVCETALRSGTRTPLILYSYGTGLRRIRGRLGDASAILAQVGTEEPYRLLALYSIGQIAAGRGETLTALNLFRRVEEEAWKRDWSGFLAARATRSRAELLLASGRGPEALQLFESLLWIEKNPLDRIGLAAAGDNSAHALDHLPADALAPVRFADVDVVDVAAEAVLEERGQRGDAADRVADHLRAVLGDHGEGVVPGHQRPQVRGVLPGPVHRRRERGIEVGVESRQLSPHGEDLPHVSGRSAPDLNGHRVTTE